MSEHVRVSTDAGVTTITLARPEKKNALTQAMYAAMADAVAAAEADDSVRVILLAAEGDLFCAGNDIGDFLAIATNPAKATEARNAFRYLHNLAGAQKPVIAAVAGHGVGIGLTMLLHCDLVYIAEDARVTAPFVGLGLSPEAGSSLTLPERIGHARAFAVFALGEPISGRDAAANGFANAALPAAEVLPRAQAAAATLAQRAPGALRATKALMKDAAVIQQRIADELAVFNQRLQSAEAKEAFTAFVEKRPAVFG